MLESALEKYATLKKEDGKSVMMMRLKRARKKVEWSMENPGHVRRQLLMQVWLLTLFNSSLDFCSRG